ALLHNDGYTTKGVQKLLGQGGVRNLPEVASEPAAEPEIQPGAQHALDLGDTKKPVDRAKLGKLVAELEQIRDELKKTLSNAA
ncbi:MAG: hypothetical protein HQL36_08850, partial [Alphaproteobacteria bacterium]|nr:hypothetical protein [Alphaproteobacteria bacterium]